MKRVSRRAMAARIAELEAANARLREHLRVACAISDHYLKQKLADDLAARAAESLTDNFEQSMRSVYVYGSRTQPPHTPRVIGGGGV